MVKKKADEAKSKKKTVRKATGRKKKDPNAPKRNKSAYMFFCEHHRGEVKDKHPDMKMTDISKELANMWKSCPAEEKKRMDKLANDDKKRYEKAKNEYEAGSGKKSSGSDDDE